MKIKSRTVEKLRITETGLLSDPAINLTLEDFGPGQGEVTIHSDGDAWCNYWGAMGKTTNIRSFLISASTDYLVNKLSIGLSREVNDESADALAKAALEYIIKQRRNGSMTREKARELWDDEAVWLNDDGISAQMDRLNAIFGEEWWYHLPQKSNQAYERLTNIVKVIKEALR